MDKLDKLLSLIEEMSTEELNKRIRKAEEVIERRKSMSNWVYLDCTFRLQNNISCSTNDKSLKSYIKYARRKTLKKIYKAMKHLDRIEGCAKGWDKDIRFSINTEFGTELRHKDTVIDIDDIIVVNIYGNARWETNDGGKFTDIIKDIWYHSDLDINHGIALIRDSYFGDTVLKYNSDYSQFIVEIYEDGDTWGFDNIQYFVKNFKINEEKGWFRINSKKYLISDIIKDYNKYEKHFRDMGIPITIIKKRG